jgi:hypothetical protein
MASIGKGRVLPHRGSVYIYVSKDVSNDSTFPFKNNEDIRVKISGKRIIIEKK